MRGRVFQGRVFAPFVLAGGGAVPVAYETQRHTLYGTSLERHTLTATTAQRATLLRDKCRATDSIRIDTMTTINEPHQRRVGDTSKIYSAILTAKNASGVDTPKNLTGLSCHVYDD